MSNQQPGNVEYTDRDNIGKPGGTAIRLFVEPDNTLHGKKPNGQVIDFGGGAQVEHDNSIFGLGTLLNPLGVQGYYNQVLFVSPNGDNLTAEKGRISLPYGDIIAARDAAVSGDLVYVFAGNYTLVAQQLIKEGVDYYFQPQANVHSKPSSPGQPDGWLLNDLVVTGVANTKILGYGKFTADTDFQYGFANISKPDTYLYIEFDIIDSNVGVTFVGSAGELFVKGRYLRNELQYVTVISGTCLSTFKISKIDNVSNSFGSDTGTATFIYISLVSPISGKTVKSIIEVDELNNNSNNSFCTILTIACTVSHKIIAKVGNLIHNTGTAAPVFMGTPLGVLFGGLIEFEGRIQSNTAIAYIFGGSDSESSILINDSSCITLDSTYPARPSVKVTNDNHWITIKDSIITTERPVCCVVGVPSAFGDINGGNLQVVNSVIQNTKDFTTSGTPSVNILSDRLGASIGVTLLDDATLIIKNLVPSYSVQAVGTTVPQNISILSGGVTATNDIEPVNIANTLAGPSVVLPIFGTQALNNPLI